MALTLSTLSLALMLVCLHTLVHTLHTPQFIFLLSAQTPHPLTLSSLFVTESNEWKYLEARGEAPAPRTNHAATRCGRFMYLYGGNVSSHVHTHMHTLILSLCLPLRWLSPSFSRLSTLFSPFLFPLSLSLLFSFSVPLSLSLSLSLTQVTVDEVYTVLDDLYVLDLGKNLSYWPIFSSLSMSIVTWLFLVSPALYTPHKHKQTYPPHSQTQAHRNTHLYIHAHSLFDRYTNMECAEGVRRFAWPSFLSPYGDSRWQDIFVRRRCVHYTSHTHHYTHPLHTPHTNAQCTQHIPTTPHQPHQHKNAQCTTHMHAYSNARHSQVYGPHLQSQNGCRNTTTSTSSTRDRTPGRDLSPLVGDTHIHHLAHFLSLSNSFSYHHRMVTPHIHIHQLHIITHILALIFSWATALWHGHTIKTKL